MFRISSNMLLLTLVSVGLFYATYVEAFTTSPASCSVDHRSYNLQKQHSVRPSPSFGLRLDPVSAEVKLVTSTATMRCRHPVVPKMSSSDDNAKSGIVELADDDEAGISATKAQGAPSVGPFLSQGEISEDALNPDFSDPKQTRVIIYIVLSLLPVLFLVPLMLGSRDLIPLDELPPVQM
mmetsp:Transcript_31485/g.45941  ORF Transcript_31485/g.45941 Transcript_31485/m.45941 type:complete len:180 (+) Transcript_31485:69-608(+)